MRDAFGGVFMIRLLLVFIFVYVIFAAISLNYAKAFRIKNKVISYIEENDIQSFEPLFTAADASQLSALGNMLDSYNYNLTCENFETEDGVFEREDELSPLKYCYHGILIKEVEENNIMHYEISTYVNWNLNFMNRILMLAGRTPTDRDTIVGYWRISGEARVVKRAEPENWQERNESPVNKTCPVNYTTCRNLYNSRTTDDEGNLEKKLIEKLISNQGLNLDNSCCNVKQNEPDRKRVVNPDGSPLIYDEKKYGTFEQFVNNNIDIITNLSIKYCHEQNKFSTEVQIGSTYADNNQLGMIITCSSINITSLSD